jgi:RNA polymerase sigma-70 factor (family 1)
LFINHRKAEINLKDLLLEISEGDQAAFAKLYAVFGKRLRTFSVSLVHSKEIAEEVVEDVFIKIWAKRETLSAIENIAVYLYVAVKNLSLNKLAEKAKQLIAEPYKGLDPEIESLQYDPHTLLVTSEMLAKMNQTIETLPPRCKMIFKLVREDGLRYKEVSEILNISVNTIDVQMAIAIKRISEAMGVKKIQTARLKKQKA